MNKAVKIILYVLGSILLLLVAAALFLNSQWGQNIVRGRAEAYLQQKLGTELHIGFLGVGFPKSVVIKDIFLRDRNHDTLLALGKLSVDVDMIGLIRGDIAVHTLELSGVHTHIYRSETDSVFNFGWIIDAFAGKADTTAKKDTTTASKGSLPKIKVGRILLSDIHGRLDDGYGGTTLHLDLKDLELAMRSLDLNKMNFEVRKLAVDGLRATFIQDSSHIPPTPRDTAASPFALIAGSVDLRDINFKYLDKVGNMSLVANVGGLQMELNKFDLLDERVDVQWLELHNAGVALDMSAPQASSSAANTTGDTSATNWKVRAGDVLLDNVAFRMDNAAIPEQPKGIDYNHLDIKHLNLQLAEGWYATDSISGNLKNMAVEEKSGVQVKQLTTRFNYNSKGAVLDGLHLETPGTILHDHIEVHYPSLDSIAAHMSELEINTHLQESKIALSDVLLFVPSLEQQPFFAANKNAVVSLTMLAKGSMKHLAVARLDASGIGNTSVLLDGTLTSLHDPKSLGYDLHIARLVSTATDINAFLPDSLRKTVRIPDGLSLTGTVKGTTADYNADVNIATTDGLAWVKGYLHTSGGAGKEQYDLQASVAELNLGKILRMDTVLGPVSANVKAKGMGLQPDAMSAEMDGTIISAVAFGYRYHDIQLYGGMKQQVANVQLQSHDPNARLLVKAKMDMAKEYPALLADVKIDSIDLHALKLYASEFRAAGTMHIDVPVLNPDYPVGSFVWWDPVVSMNGKRYFPDSMYVRSQASPDSGQHMDINLGILTASLSGHIPLSRIPGAIMDHINKHYAYTQLNSRAAKDSANATQKQLVKNATDTTIGRYDLHLTADAVDQPMLRSLLPDLNSFDSLHLNTDITDEQLNVDVSLPSLEYNGIIVTNGLAKVRGADSAFTYSITADQIKKDKFDLWFADINGKVEQQLITANVSLEDADGKQRFAIAAVAENKNEGQTISLKPGLVLDYSSWDVAPANKIVLANDGLYITDFRISNGSQYISAASATPTPAAPLKVQIGNFSIGNLTRAISHSDTLLADGVLNGTVDITAFNPTLKMEAALDVTDLSYTGDTIGNLSVKVNNRKDNALDANLKLTGRGNDISVAGLYYTTPVDGNDFKFDIDVSLSALSVRAVQAMTNNALRNSAGFVKGKLSAEGTVNAPRLKGELRTENMETNVAMLNANFSMPKERLVFEGDAARFDDFTIYDKDGNKGVLSGTISFPTIDDIKMDMRLNARKWRVLQSKKEDNKQFFGDMLITTDMSVSGPLDGLSVEGTLRILKGTDLTIVNTQANPELISRKGIVVFKNMKDTARKNVLAPQKHTAPKKSSALGPNVNVNITADKDAKFSLVLDQASGDFLSVKGDLNVNASVSGNGVISLAGLYAVNDGAYQLNYNLIKRKFKIDDGSVITFAGDPVKGTSLNLDATYEAMVAPYDLVQRQVSDPTQLNYYKQRLPFDVKLYLNGPVLTPHLSFDITLPDGKAYKLGSDQLELVQAKLSQVRTDTSELNKQVFAVLILNRFVSDDPFSSGASSSASFAALQSVSTFLGEQLNRAADKFVKGVDFSVDLATTEDYTTGSLRQRTDLNLAASKQFLNDRLKLTLGNNFELEGPQTTNNNQSYIPSNLAADYLLTPDGKYILRGYRRAYDVGVLQGFVTETGLNFIVSYDYNKFSNMFGRKKHRKARTAKTDSTSAGPKENETDE